MSTYARGRGDEVDDFDEYDPTPSSGGYDIVLTYGRPLPPSDETCYPLSSSQPSDDFNYDHPQYNFYAEPSAYRDEALDTEYSSYARPKPRLGPPSPGEGDFDGAEYGARPDVDHGFPPPGVNRPGYGVHWNMDQKLPDQNMDLMERWTALAVPPLIRITLVLLCGTVWDCWTTGSSFCKK